MVNAEETSPYLPQSGTGHLEGDNDLTGTGSASGDEDLPGTGPQEGHKDRLRQKRPFVNFTILLKNCITLWGMMYPSL